MQAETKRLFQEEKARAEAVKEVAVIGPDEISTIGQLIIQLAIGIATIWKLIKKPKNKNGNNTGNENA